MCRSCAGHMLDMCRTCDGHMVNIYHILDTYLTCVGPILDICESFGHHLAGHVLDMFAERAGHEQSYVWGMP